MLKIVLMKLVIYIKYFTKNILFKEIFENKSLTCLADCQLQPPACQESGRSPADPPLSLALAENLTAEVAPWHFPHG